VADLLTDIGAGRQPRPSFADGLQVQRVLDAVERSAADGSAWTPTAAAPARAAGTTGPGTPA
jgi:hypothetical protein